MWRGMSASPSPSPDEHLPIGSLLDGRYKIEAVLGSGGMGRVYRAEHTKIGRPVAIKVLHQDLTRNREASQRFQREAIASGRLDHPNIVGVSDFGVLDDGACYLVMEVLEGESLGGRLARDRRVPWPEAVEIIRGVLHGLRHAHERGVVHRDIKPDNIFLARKDGELIIKILDFGIAKLYAGSADDPASTRTGLTVGTPAYLSPEQAVGGAITPASDIYSASIVLFEMLAGRPPFESKDPLAMLGAHVSRPPPRIAEVAPDLEFPPLLEDVIRHGLEKSASDRIASAADYLSLLEMIAPAAQGTSHRLGSQSGSLPPDVGRMPTLESGVIRSQELAMLGAGTAPTSVLPATPPPEASDPGRAPVAPSEPMPVVASRAVSLVEPEPIPRGWLVKGGIVIGALTLVALVLVLKSALGSSSSTEQPAVATPRPPVIAPVIIHEESELDRETKLKAALHDLETGKTCNDRKAAIPKLVELQDPDAIPSLKKARYRMVGGIFGLGQDNANQCLKADAEKAIKDLGGTLK